MNDPMPEQAPPTSVQGKLDTFFGMLTPTTQAPVEAEDEDKGAVGRASRQEKCVEELTQAWPDGEWCPAQYKPRLSKAGKVPYNIVYNMVSLTKLWQQHHRHLPDLWQQGGPLYEAVQKSRGQLSESSAKEAKGAVERLLNPPQTRGRFKNRRSLVKNATESESEALREHSKGARSSPPPTVTTTKATITNAQAPASPGRQTSFTKRKTDSFPLNQTAGNLATRSASEQPSGYIADKDDPTLASPAKSQQIPPTAHAYFTPASNQTRRAAEGGAKSMHGAGGLDTNDGFDRYSSCDLSGLDEPGDGDADDSMAAGDLPDIEQSISRKSRRTMASFFQTSNRTSSAPGTPVGRMGPGDMFTRPNFNPLRSSISLIKDTTCTDNRSSPIPTPMSNTITPALVSLNLTEDHLRSNEWLTAQDLQNCLLAHPLGKDWTRFYPGFPKMAGDGITKEPFQDKAKHGQHIVFILNPTGNHWVLGYWNRSKKELTVYDPMKSDGHMEQVKSFMTSWLSESEGPTTRFISGDCPQQDDAYNCGIFCLAFASALFAGQPLPSSVDPELLRIHYMEHTRAISVSRKRKRESSLTGSEQSLVRPSSPTNRQQSEQRTHQRLSSSGAIDAAEVAASIINENKIRIEKLESQIQPMNARMERIYEEERTLVAERSAMEAKLEMIQFSMGKLALEKKKLAKEIIEPQKTLDLLQRVLKAFEEPLDGNAPAQSTSRSPASSSSPTRTISVPERTTSLPSTNTMPTSPPAGPALSIPQRSSSKRQKSQQWDSKFTNMSKTELEENVKKIGDDLSRARGRLKRQISMDDEYWNRYLEVSRLHLENAQAASQLGLREFKAAPGQSWYDEPAAQALKLQYDSWSQYRSIMKKHMQKMRERVNSGRETFFRLFATSKVGLNLPGGVGRRDTSQQSNFVASMMEAYCPDPPADNYRWDPVLQRWQDSANVKAAHLFPYRQSHFMDDIFGDGASSELFTATNGLFLHFHIEKALDDGVLAIVPDLDLEPADPSLPLNDQQERQDRVKEWEKMAVKDYKIVVINKKHKQATSTRLFTFEQMTIQTLGDLHGRKLVFKTDFRPRARYVWWTFLNTILRTAWIEQKAGDENTQHQEVRKPTRYWGTRGRYVKQNQLHGFVDEIGHDVESILEYGLEDGTQEPGIEAVGAMVQEAIVQSTEGETEDEEEDEEE
ncbi:hypothetical protein G7046_g4011 [Stylonectria norvegica]|nr:hypothetical protein G7046_g4011 [Stylonectria norvegica]